MKVTKRTNFSSFFVETDEEHSDHYTRYSKDNWCVRLGESDEPAYGQEEELEEAFQEYQKQINNMKNHYVTFGQDHTHDINGKLLHKDVVAVFKVNNYKEGRTKAFEYFGDKFCFDYFDTQFDQNNMSYFPGGFVNLD